MTAQPVQFPRFIGAEIYRGSSYGGWHPLRVPRVSTVMDLSRALGWLPRDRFVVSPRAKPAALAAWHSPAYLQALVQAEADQRVTDETRDRHGLGTTSNPVFPEMYRRPATAAGGSRLPKGAVRVQQVQRLQGSSEPMQQPHSRPLLELEA